MIKQNNKNLLEEIINYFNEKGFYSYLTTLKEYGNGNKNLLSFGEKGLSITLDIPLNGNFTEVYKEFEKNLAIKILRFISQRLVYVTNFFQKYLFKIE